ncbi:MAG: cobalamin B12-binding domain-containing protein [Bdellovibrionaceae bacterium]|nr:cobalamin B12-binding domain-containing protein [Bdellovibrionales bacterium]MCB9085677.1 cobalamin B12-binding domain-containing protein [Pseudobdellovibrionaceae bacterium]
MIRWCSYCQRFLSEAPPYEDLAVSHGACSECAALGPTGLDQQVDTGRAISELQGQLWEAAKGANYSEIQRLLGIAQAIRVRNSDLLLGMISPLLYKVGLHWEKKKLSVADEHRITRFFEQVYHQVKTSSELDVPPRNNKSQPDVLLINAPNNHHTLAVRFLEMWLEDRGISVMAIYPGLPAEEVTELIAKTKPKALGISISMENQATETLKIVDQVHQKFPSVKIMVGGCAVKTGKYTPLNQDKAIWSTVPEDLAQLVAA